MKKFLLTLMAALMVAITASAIPAYNKPVKLQMPDGKYVTVIGHGDEYFNYLTTSDGYTIVTCDDDYFRYAQLSDGKLVATDIIAHDAAERTSAELSYIAKVGKYLIPEKMTADIKRLAPVSSEKIAGQEYTDDVPYLQNKAARVNKNYKGLVILVNYNDCEFRLGDDAKAIFNSMINDENFTGYNDPRDGKFKQCTGSVHDYFRDNSYGDFQPKFDVIGPINIDRSMYDFNGNYNSQAITRDVIKAIDADVNFADYDSDKDGVVDMFYIIYAGYASSYDGNNSKLLWPHATQLYSAKGTSYKADGVILRRYACSTELYGWQKLNDYELNGIGTICHEFSHVLGYEDHYDTSSSNHEVPGDWDVMCAGSYNGTCGRTPAGYNTYERLTGGFINPTILTTANIGETCTLNNLMDNREAYRLNTKSAKEYFLVENRQKIKWDYALPGHGMLVWKVDSTDASLFTYNQVNATNRLCIKLIRANGNASIDSQADAFPGSKNVTSLTNDTKANLVSYSGYKSPIVFRKIKEKDQVVSFMVSDPDSDVSGLPKGVVFYESFNACEGTGGNDGTWETSSSSYFESDMEGWTYNTYLIGADKCVRVGQSGTKGYAVTPTFKLDSGTTYKLTFRTSPYPNQGTGLTLSVNSGNATLTNDADYSASPSTKVTLSTVAQQWNDFSFTITGSGEQTLKFVGGSSRNSYSFFLDEVKIYDPSTTAISNVTVENRQPERYFNLNGQQVSKNAKGIVIVNGKKMIIK